MQATLDATALKPFTRALTCLSKYGDDLAIYASTDGITLSATNSSMSAYCRFQYSKLFFAKFSIGGGEKRTNPGPYAAEEIEEVKSVTGQLLTKSFLSILRHRAIEKTVERCDLSIVEGSADGPGQDDDEDKDSLESKLIIRLHCKHGIVKTHRLLLLTPTSLLAPNAPDDPTQSRMTIGPKALKDMIDHFPSTRGAKTDPQLTWAFDESEVRVRSLETSVDLKGGGQLTTELTMSAEEFDMYEVSAPPTSIAFHLREFNATIAYAESMSLALNLRFTEPAAPLFVDVEEDSAESLFVVSTSQVPGVPPGGNGANSTQQSRGTTTSGSSSQIRKRVREESPERNRNMAPRTPASERRRPPMKAVQRTDAAEFARQQQQQHQSQTSQLSRAPYGSMPPPSIVPRQQSQQSNGFHFSQARNGSQFEQEREPLFLPSSQMSQADAEALRASGLGVDNMDADEFFAMMEEEGEEVGVTLEEALLAPRDGGVGAGVKVGSDSGSETEPESDLEMLDELGPTQSLDGNKDFKPLFED